MKIIDNTVDIDDNVYLEDNLVCAWREFNIIIRL